MACVIPAPSIKAMLLFQLVYAYGVLCSDMDVLLSFKSQVIGASNITSSWNLSSPCMSWQGVACFADGTTVVKLSVTGVPISGAIPPVLGQLKSLKRLELFGNNLKGPIPEELGNCTSLEYLGLYDNELSGQIPESITRLTSLQQLILHNNSFSGTLSPNIGNLKNLTKLDVRMNHISGQLPEAISKLQNLQYLYLDDNNFKGSIPTSLQKCQKLCGLSLANNSFTGNIPWELGFLSSINSLLLDNNQLSGRIPSSLGSLSQLQNLSLSNNSLHGEIPGTLGQLVNIQRLHIAQNNLTGMLPDLGNCTALVRLNLYDNNLSGNIPPSIGKLPLLQELRLYNNSFTGQIPYELGKYSNLSVLYISNNRLQGRIPPSLCAQKALRRAYLQSNFLTGLLTEDLLECPTLERLFVQNNLLHGRITVRECSSSLHDLNLSYNHFNGSIPSLFSSCKNLTGLDLSKNSLSGEIPSLPTSLQQLSLSGNQLTGGIPAVFGPRLFSLDLSYNNLTGSIQDITQQLMALQHLLLQGNQLTGPLPPDLCRSSGSLLDLNLGNNGFDGPLPPSFSCFQFLNNLDISRNKLSGHIPPQFGRLQMLLSLNLSDNQLSGQIPDQLATVRSLQEVDLSHNYLVGPLPESWKSRFSPASFIGNPGLCLGNTTCSKASKGHAKALIAGIVAGLLAFFVLAAGSAACWCKSRVASCPPTKYEGKHISMEAVIRATDNFSNATLVGEGSYGVVHKGLLENGQAVAVKKLKPHNMDYESSRREWASAGQVKHRNIVRLLAFLRHEGTEFLVYDWMQNGNVRNLLESTKLVPWCLRCKIALGTAEALAYLHHDCVPKVVHRDIKSSNILLDEELEPKLADFGLAKLIEKHAENKSMSYAAGTWGYIAPEYAYTLKVDEKSDVYSFGVVLLELLVGKSPVDSMFQDQDTDMVTWVRKKMCDHGLELVIDPEMWAGSTENHKVEMKQVVKLALFCTSRKPGERPTMREVLEVLRQSLQLGRSRSNKSRLAVV